jgi:TrmH family RNA methyltransferase
MITSVANERVKLIRTLQAQAKARAREKLFVIEGERLLVEAVRAHAPLRMVLHSGGLKPPQRSLLNQAARLGAEIEEVSPEILKACSDTTSPPGMLAVVPWVEAPLAAPLEFVLLADGLANPGNLGTVLRTAEAFGVQAVFLMPGCVDAYNPKVVRGAMGAHFRLPVVESTWPEAQARLRAFRLYLAEASQGTPCDEISWRGRIGLILGSEAEGAGALARAAASARVRIPMPGSAESLNAVVAAGILLYQAARQRRSRS